MLSQKETWIVQISTSVKLVAAGMYLPTQLKQTRFQELKFIVYAL